MTEWTDREPGQVASPLRDDPSVLVLGSWVDICDEVTAPDELGGGHRRTVARGYQMCPCCETVQAHIHVDGGLGIVECKSSLQFYWYRVPEGYGLQQHPESVGERP